MPAYVNPTLLTLIFLLDHFGFTRFHNQLTNVNNENLDLVNVEVYLTSLLNLLIIRNIIRSNLAFYLYALDRHILRKIFFVRRLHHCIALVILIEILALQSSAAIL